MAPRTEAVTVAAALLALVMITPVASAQESAGPPPHEGGSGVASPDPAVEPPPPRDDDADGTETSTTTTSGGSANTGTTTPAASTSQSTSTSTSTSTGTAPGASHQPTGGSTGTQAAPPPASSPGPYDPYATSSRAQREADEEEDDDGRDVDILWIEGTFGFSWANLVQFKQDNFFPDAVRLSGSGLTYGVAAGFRLSFIMIGARATLGTYPAADFDLGTAVVEVSLRLPVPVVEPYIRAGIGFAWMGSVNYDSPSNSDTTVHGLAVEGGAGVDVYLGKIVAVGGGIDVAFLNMTRQDIPGDGCGGGTCSPTSVDLEQDGDSAGLQLRVAGHVSLHF